MTDDIMTTMELILNKVDVSVMATKLVSCLHIFFIVRTEKTAYFLKSSFLANVQKSNSANTSLLLLSSCSL